MQFLVLVVTAAIAGSPYRAAEAQAQAAKALRAANPRRDDLYRNEETIHVLGEGHIQSPRYPNGYPRNVLLSWKLISQENSRIQLDFDRHFGLEDAENDVCRYDFVEVEDVSETSTIIWGRWCGQKETPPRITSNTNTVKVTFKSDDYFVVKPGFKLYYSLVDGAPASASERNWEAVTFSISGPSTPPTAVTDGPLNAVAALDQTVASFDTVEELLKHLNPESWQDDMDGIYWEAGHYRPRAYHHERRHKVDLDRLNEDVKRYSCTPRNLSVNLREELRVTSAVFFPRCLLVLRCGGNCACGTSGWNSCSCSPSKTSDKLYEVLKFSPEPSFFRKRTRAQWVLEEIHLQHHEQCDCVCHSRPPR
ncbi:platelet-derived growth factor D [Paramormyrops kingsleyae]|uniref:Platelet-derived growth factor D n=1 Tax=Paramormyrops kingsleyae TaxID=1676925 RepID=A0A3B3QPJ8_9TELE|nr:platelet-derived growth factor D [Paramormyrops kingsleyae]